VSLKCHLYRRVSGRLRLARWGGRTGATRLMMAAYSVRLAVLMLMIFAISLGCSYERFGEL